MSIRVLLTRLCIISGLCCSGATAVAADMEALSDEALSDVRGGDGISFAANVNFNAGAFTLGGFTDTNGYHGVTDTGGNPASLAMNNLAITGVFVSTFDIVSGAAMGIPDYVNLAFPILGPGVNVFNISYDQAINDNGNTFGTGVTIQNLAFNGSSLQLSPNASGGVGFGVSLNMAIDNVLLQPTGVGNSAGQMSFSGIKLGAASGGFPSTVPNDPWVLADLAAQPGIFTIAVDSDSNPYVELGIGWPTGSTPAQSGSLQINDIKFTTPSGNIDIGASSIGSIQIQYLNIKLKS
ncbi:MAG: DUF6160 family protein [Burkholderiales bacterium]